MWAFFRAQKDREQSIADEFWFRKIILPECWDPLLEVFKKYVSKLQQIDCGQSVSTVGGELRMFGLEFAAEKNQIIGRFVLLTAFNEELNVQVRELLDELEDELADYFASIDPESVSNEFIVSFAESLFWKKLATISQAIMQLHPHKRIPFIA